MEGSRILGSLGHSQCHKPSQWRDCTPHHQVKAVRKTEHPGQFFLWREGQASRQRLWHLPVQADRAGRKRMPGSKGQEQRASPPALNRHSATSNPQGDQFVPALCMPGQHLHQEAQEQQHPDSPLNCQELNCSCWDAFPGPQRWLGEPQVHREALQEVTTSSVA